MPDILDWLASLGRTRVIPGDIPPEDVRATLAELVREHRTALGLPIVGRVLTAADINDALDWYDERRADATPPTTTPTPPGALT